MATLKNRADLLTEAATNLPDNTSQEISPQDVREMAENLAESNFNRVTDSALVGLKTYNTGVVYESGQGAIYSGNIYVANKNTTPGAFNPADWDQVTAELGNVENTQTTGIISGGLISINADNTKFDLAAGKAVVVDNSDLTAVVISEISWTAQAALTAGNLATEPRTNLAISLTNEVLPNVTYTNSFTATVNGASQLIYIAEKSTDNFNSLERRKVANLGRLVHTAGTVITNAVNLQQHVNSVLNSFLDFVSLFPAQNVEGNEFSGKVGTLGVAKTAGKGFRFGSNYDTDTNDPNNQAIPAADPTTHFYRYQDGAGGFSQSAPLTVLDPANYDNGSGTLATVSPNRWTLQPVWVFAGSGTMFVQYGQTEFSTKEAAIGALPTVNPVLDQNLVNDAVFRGYFIIKQGATDLSDSAQFEWRAPLGEIGGGQGAGVVVDLQAAFNASFNPEITTDSTRGALTIKRGSAADTDLVLEIKNGADAITFSVDGNGLVTGNGSGLTNIGNLENNLTNLGTLGAGQDGQALIWDNATSRFIMGSAGGDNFATADLTFTGNRVHTLSGNTLEIVGTATPDWFKVRNSVNNGGFGVSNTEFTFIAGGTDQHRMFIGNAVNDYLIWFQNGISGQQHFSVGNVAKIDAENITFDGRTAIKGANTLGGVNDVAFEIYDGDTTPTKLWDFRNNGDIVTGQSIVFQTPVSNAGISNYRPTSAVNNGTAFYVDLNNSSGTKTSYGWFGATIRQNTAGSEYGSPYIYANINGTMRLVSEVDVFNNKGFTIDGTNFGGTSNLFTVYGSGTSSKFEIKNNGDLYTNGTQGLSNTYNFGGGGSGDVATMTFTNGILTAVTTVP